MAAILAAILNLITRNFFRLRPKLYLIYQKLALCHLNMILVVTMYIVIYDFNKLTFLYKHVYIYLLSCLLL